MVSSAYCLIPNAIVVFDNVLVVGHDPSDQADVLLKSLLILVANTSKTSCTLIF